MELFHIAFFNLNLCIEPTESSLFGGQGDELVVSVSVARVRPRASKGITDLLLPQTSIGLSR